MAEIKSDELTIASHSETVTENLFRDFYGVKAFIEKSAISKNYGFKSKKGTGYKGYPDFLREEKDYLIVVECKADTKDHVQAEDETKHYISNVSKKYNVIGIAVSGQSATDLKVTHFISVLGGKSPEDINIKNLLKLPELSSVFIDKSTKINYSNLISYADKLNTVFHENFKIAVHRRPFFFAGLLFSFDKITTFLSNYVTEQLEIKKQER